MVNNIFKYFCSTVCFTFMLSAAAVEIYEDLSSVQKDRAMLDSKDTIALNAIERMEQRKLPGIVTTPDEIEFIYGNGIQTVVCALLEISDIVMQENEHILSVQLGDTSRWILDSVVSGSENSFTEHLIVKPLDNNLTTSLLIATDKRSYHLRLKSSAKNFMPLVRFSYPEQRRNLINKDNSNNFANGRTTQSNSYKFTGRKNKGSYPKEDSVPLNARHYGYEITGNERIVPVNAYDDGVNTYIQLNETYFASSLPTVMEVTDDGSLFFADETLSALNYSLENNTFVIEGIYDHLRLIEIRGSSEISADIRRV